MIISSESPNRVVGFVAPVIVAAGIAIAGLRGHLHIAEAAHSNNVAKIVDRDTQSQWPVLPPDTDDMQLIGPNELLFKTDTGSFGLADKVSGVIRQLWARVDIFHYQDTPDGDGTIAFQMPFFGEDSGFRSVGSFLQTGEIIFHKILHLFPGDRILDIKGDSIPSPSSDDGVHAFAVMKNTIDGVLPMWIVGPNGPTMDPELIATIRSNNFPEGDITDQVNGMTELLNSKMQEFLSKGGQVYLDEEGNIILDMPDTPNAWYRSDTFPIQGVTNIDIKLKEGTNKVLAVFNMSDGRARFALGEWAEEDGGNLTIDWGINSFFLVNRNEGNLATNTTIVETNNGDWLLVYQSGDQIVSQTLTAVHQDQNSSHSPNRLFPVVGERIVLADVSGQVTNITGVKLARDLVVNYQEGIKFKTVVAGENGMTFDASQIDMSGDIIDWDVENEFDTTNRDVIAQFTVVEEDGTTTDYVLRLENGKYVYIPVAKIQTVNHSTGETLSSVNEGVTADVDAIEYIESTMMGMNNHNSNITEESQFDSHYND